MRLLLPLFFGAALGDVYLHCPRGANNRLDEEGRERNNANRCHDSQNNNRGGYNVGSVYYYNGSVVTIEWTSQHSCGHPNSGCEVIIQIACDDRIRDGTTTETIPIDPNQCYNYNCDTDVRYGRHESWQYYMNCTYRQRNKGLFTADRILNGNGAKYTRQNEDGTRYGYECPEERDYYPYWAPTPWRDLIVLTNDANPERCAAYQAESQNVKSRFFCSVPATYLAYRQWQTGVVPLTKEDCERLNYTAPTTNTIVFPGKWIEVPAWGFNAAGSKSLTCLGNAWARDNHHGNVEGGHFVSVNWTVPRLSTFKFRANENPEHCILRLRYNITTGDFPGFASATSLAPGVDASSNGKGNNGNGKTNPILLQSILDDYKLTNTSAFWRQYRWQNNPQVDIFGSLLTNGTDGNGNTVARVRLQLAINTAQFFRTFEDRTHTFALRTTPGYLNGKTIRNVQVRGKRGNIVQVYPGTEYDFCPTDLICAVGEFVHFQWTGSNSNPHNNAGQGRAGSDRSNVIRHRDPVYIEYGFAERNNNNSIYGQWGTMYPANITARFLGLSELDKQHLAILDLVQYGGSMDELDDAGTYFDLGPRECTQTGTYHYLSTRNNNFSNRAQQAKIVVQSSVVLTASFAAAGATISTATGVGAGSSITATPGAMASQQVFVVELFDPTKTKNNLCSGDRCASALMLIQPSQPALAPGRSLDLSLKYSPSGVAFAALYRSDSLNGEWTKVDDYTCTPSTGLCTAAVTRGGYYGVKTRIASEVIVPLVLLVVAIIVVTVMWWKGMFCFSNCRGPSGGKGANSI